LRILASSTVKIARFSSQIKVFQASIFEEVLKVLLKDTYRLVAVNYDYVSVEWVRNDFPYIL
jgi:hypothetical protein